MKGFLCFFEQMQNRIYGMFGWDEGAACHNFVGKGGVILQICSNQNPEVNLKNGDNNLKLMGF